MVFDFGILGIQETGRTYFKAFIKKINSMKTKFLTVREIFLNHEEIKEAIRFFLEKKHGILFSEDYKIENWGYTGDMRIEIDYWGENDNPKTV